MARASCKYFRQMKLIIVLTLGINYSIAYGENKPLIKGSSSCAKILSPTNLNANVKPKRKVHVYETVLNVRGQSYWAGRAQVESHAPHGTRGGTRFGLDVNKKKLEEFASLMDDKADLHALPFGGAKGGVAVDTKKISAEEFEEVSRAYARWLYNEGIIGIDKDSIAPDMGTSDTPAMSYMMDEIIYLASKSGRIKSPIIKRDMANYLRVNQPYASKELGVGLTPALTKYIKIAHEYAARGINVPTPELSMVTAKPVSFGGLPGREEATGFGVYISLRETLKWKQNGSNNQNIDNNQNLINDKTQNPMSGIKIGIQGFGNVGSNTAHFINEAGGKITVVAEFCRKINAPVLISNPDGIDIAALMKFRKKGNFSEFTGGKVTVIKNAELAPDEFASSNVDVLIPAALSNQITEKNSHLIKPGTIIIEGANAPITKEAAPKLLANGVIVVPGQVANSMGVAASFMEQRLNVTEQIDHYPDQNLVYQYLDKQMVSVLDKLFLQVGPYRPGTAPNLQAAIDKTLEEQRLLAQ